ncbi:MAG: hypothetical protein DI551_06990 [Micavibrio aeruginosavorus]|uniref:ABC transporter permease n=1 Tax=Micavibrio aeruginosavorus TaxID=349221 RepID=A0A2W5MW86_9BACT|nr:MAG: hypothetical protein DI551_06990 [Micavibrio aeruginosavorus]
MNILTLALAAIRAHKLQSALCIAALACGIALLVTVSLLFVNIESGLKRNAEGVDVIVGAKGSPLQLVLSSIYHADIPNGNINVHEMEELQKNPQVKKAIPLAIGDNYKGFRIVGTSPEYVDLYKGEIAEGKNFSALYEAVAGSQSSIPLGTKFAALHGFSADSDDVHDAHLYTVVGRLKPTGTVLDKLILTSYQSVQDLHGRHEDHDHEEGHHDEDEEDEEALGHQITALLIKTKTPVGVMNLPREINQHSDVMAASPSHVMARTMSSLGLGRNVLVIVGGAFFALSMLMLFSILTSGLSQRRYDLAVLRVLGGGRSFLFGTVLAEGLILSAIGAIAGAVMGHVFAFLIASYVVPAMQSVVLPDALLAPSLSDVALIGAGILCGGLASLVPAITASRADIAGLLAQGRA